MSRFCITDEQVFDTSSSWYRLAVQLFKEWANKKCSSGHRHHWIPCSIVASLMLPRNLHGEYRARADELYPQELVKMPLSAHILIHYFVWQAVHKRFKRMMQHAFEGLYGMKPPPDEYTKCLDAYIEKEGHFGTPLAADEVPEPSQFENSSLAVVECSLCWKAYDGLLTWPKFQCRFMQKFKRGRKALRRKG